MINWFKKKEPAVYRIAGGNNSPYWGKPEDMIMWRPKGEAWYRGSEVVIDGIRQSGPFYYDRFGSND